MTFDEIHSIPVTPSSGYPTQGEGTVALFETEEAVVATPALKIGISLDTPVEGSDAALSATPSEHREPPIAPTLAPEPAMNPRHTIQVLNCGFDPFRSYQGPPIAILYFIH